MAFDRQPGNGLLFDRHISLGSLLSTLVVIGSATGLYAAFRAEAAVQVNRTDDMEVRIMRLEENREVDRKELNALLNQMNERLWAIQVTLARKQDIGDEPPPERKRP